MALDLSRFAGAFFEESLEHLSGMEKLLLDLDLGQPDPESLNGIFRAAHSIKGGAGIFGFQHLADLTHVLESLLDKLRKRELRPSKRLVDLVLRTGDIMRRYVAGMQTNGSADETELDSVRPALEAYGRGAVPELDSTQEDGNGGAGPGRYQVSISLNPAEFPDEPAVDALIDDIRGTGKVTIRSKGLGGTSLVLEIETGVDKDELRDSLEFLISADAIQVSPLVGGPTSAAVPVLGISSGVINSSAPVSATGEGVAYGFFEPQAPQTGSATAPQATVAEVHGGLPGTESARELAIPETQGTPETREAWERRKGKDRRGEADTGAGGTLMDGSSIRINVEKVDQLVNLVGELVIAQSMVSQAARSRFGADDAGLGNALGQLERNTRDLQEAVMSIRMLPIGFVFNRFPRLVRDLAGRLGKRVRLEIQGEDTELDKGLIERISDPLTHLVRNALDHGIETPRERQARRKPAEGLVTLTATHQAGAIVITVSDDGAGIDKERILAKARTMGFPVDASMSEQDIYQIIFAPGFSTAREVTDVSGRGVGMDVVKRNVTSLGGRIEITSTLGAGTSIQVRLPLTLAIIDGMSIRLRDQVYIIPLAHISESLQPTPGQVKTVNGKEVVDVRGEYLPVVSLATYLGFSDPLDGGTGEVLVILETEQGHAALRVDELVGQQQVVLKSLEANFRKVEGLSGATIMGDGRVAFILDVGAIIGSMNVAVAESIREHAPETSD